MVARQVLPQNSPAGDAAIVGRDHRRHAVDLLHDLKSAFSGVLPSVPKIRRGHDKFHRIAFAKRCNFFCRLAQGQILLTVFPEHIKVAGGIGSEKEGRQHIESVVQSGKKGQGSGNFSRADHMEILRELREELPFEHIPAAVQPGLAQTCGQAFELVNIIRVACKKNRIVVHLCRDKAIVLGALSFAVFPVDKEPLDPGVSQASGIAGQVDPFGIILNATQTGLKNSKL